MERWAKGPGSLSHMRALSLSPFNLSQTLPVGGGLLVLHSLSGSPVIKQLMQMVTMVPGQGERSQSVCFP